jgi:hypothetical protein
MQKIGANPGAEGANAGALYELPINKIDSCGFNP